MPTDPDYIEDESLYDLKYATSSHYMEFDSDINEEGPFIELKKPKWAISKRCKLISFIILSLSVVVVVSMILALYLYIPKLVQQKFYALKDSTSSSSDIQIDFTMFTTDAFYFSISHTYIFPAICNVKLYFDEPISLRTDSHNLNNTLVGQLDFPTITWGPNLPFNLNHNFTFSINNTEIWGGLWIRWFNRAFLPAERPRQRKALKKWLDLKQNETIWNISSSITVEILGFKVSKIPVYTIMPWSGGMSAGNAPSSPVIVDKTFNVLQADLNITMQYNNTCKYSMNLGTLEFSVSSLYYPDPDNNPDLTAIVKVGNIDIPDFYYKPGVNNFSVDTRFMVRPKHSILNIAQGVKKFLWNETNYFQISDFRSSYPGKKEVKWLNEALSSLFFVIPLQRAHSLPETYVKNFGSTFSLPSVFKSDAASAESSAENMIGDRLLKMKLQNLTLAYTEDLKQ